MSRPSIFRTGFLSFLAILVLGFQAVSARADELFVVIGVEPITPEIVAGATYRSLGGQSEFIYVPEGVRIALLSEGGQRYLIDGRNAVLADTQSLSEFRIERIENPDPGFLDRLFGIGLPTEFVAATRRFNEEDLSISPGNISQMSTIFVDLLADPQETATFCLFSDSAVVRRSDDAGSIPLTFTVNGIEHTGSWRHGEKDLTLKGLSLPENKAVEVDVRKGLSERRVRLKRMNATALEKGLFGTIVTLSRNDCTIQAVLLSKSMKPE